MNTVLKIVSGLWLLIALPFSIAIALDNMGKAVPMLLCVAAVVLAFCGFWRPWATLASFAALVIASRFPVSGHGWH